MKYLTYLVILIFFSASAQNTIKGKVLDSLTKEPVELVTVVNANTGKWTITDQNGHFTLHTLGSEFVLEFSILGKKKKILTQNDFLNKKEVVVLLKNDDLRLNEVVVIGEPKRSKVGSALVLDEYAIDQIQAYSLSDILSQLPGQSITSPSLNSTNTISLRTAQPSSLNAFGVSYIIDGMQLSNDENMQTYNNGSLTSYDNPNTGIDLRTIPASNIDEIEVVSGIPDAKYGNLTTGVIKINRKAGLTPYRISANIREGNSTLSIDKGFKLSDKLGNLSLSLDYLNANSDPRNSLEQYNRVTFSGIWSVFNTEKTIKNTLSLTFRSI